MHVVKLGISACLLGERTRYDGSGKLDPFLAETLGRCVRFVPVCPEVECGLGVPREPMRLEVVDGGPRLVTVRTRRDMTASMERAAAGIFERLEKEALWGFIFKSRSPSCGPVAAVRGPRGPAKGKGIFMRLWEERFPLLPAEGEDRMRSPDVRSHFIGRLFILKRWRDTVERGTGRPGLFDFHARHALSMLAHSETHCRKMDALLAEAGLHPGRDLSTGYGRLLLEALARRATIRKHVKVLRRASGYLGGRWAADEKQEMEEWIAAFRAGLAPLIAPLVLLSRHARRYDVPLLNGQHYLNPDPAETMLLYHA